MKKKEKVKEGMRFFLSEFPLKIMMKKNNFVFQNIFLDDIKNNNLLLKFFEKLLNFVTIIKPICPPPSPSKIKLDKWLMHNFTPIIAHIIPFENIHIEKY